MTTLSPESPYTPHAHARDEISDCDRRRRHIPSRFTTWGEFRAYIAGAVAQSRERARRGIPASHLPARHGYCLICGHKYPGSECPVCVSELAGEIIHEQSPAWLALM